MSAVDRLDLLEVVKQESQGRRTLRRVGFLIFPATLLGPFIFDGLSARAMVSSLPAIIVFVAVLAFTRMTGGDRTSRAVASLLRIARCGGCGFPLQELPIDADGCVVCPECSAAWNHDRWQSQPAIVGTLAINALERSAQTSIPRREVDDRGALLPMPATWKPSWHMNLLGMILAGKVTREHARAYRAFDATARAQAAAIWRRFWLLALLAVVGVGIVVALDHDAAFLFFVLMIVVGHCAYLVQEHVRQRVDIRAIALAHRLCPACGWLLDLAQPPQFDGCIQCTQCASAWKATSVREPEPRTHAAPPSLAYRLGRAISNSERGDA